MGKTYGWCFYDAVGFSWGESKYEDVVDWGKQFNELLNQWKPALVIVSQTNNFGFWDPTRKMLIQAGVAFYIAGKKGIPAIEYNDSSARKALFGKAIKKKEVQKRLSELEMPPNALDAYVLAKGFALYSKDAVEL